MPSTGIPIDRVLPGEISFSALSNTRGTTSIVANTTGNRYLLMGLQGATNATGTTVIVQTKSSANTITGPIPTIANTTIEGFSCTGFPYGVTADDKGMEIIVSGSARLDGCLQYLKIGNA
jgi:hypothetical protein